MTIIQRIRRLETVMKVRWGVAVPGTVLSRCLGPTTEDGLMWSLGVGMLSMPKKFFVGKTIPECLAQAEEEFLSE